jgi:hypothetical protein
MPHITFIHGIANKPEENKLKEIWLDSLSNDILNNVHSLDLGALGVSTSMTYWGDVLYDRPNEIIQESVSDLESVDEVAEKATTYPDMLWREELSGDDRKLVDSLAAKFSFDLLVNDDYIPAKEYQWDVIGLLHAGSDTLPCINGKSGIYKANEGIWIQNIRDALNS